MRRFLALDNILAASFFFAGKWEPSLKGNQSRDLLRFLVCKIYDQGRGKMIGTHITLAQGTIARKIGISGKWCWELCQRLQQTGWIEYSAPFVAGGMRSSSTFTVGRQLKRLIVMLLKSLKPKSQRKSVTADQWKFSPTEVEKKILLIQQREQEPPKPELLDRLPLLKRWLGRGEQ